jgi:hypothetical protein
MFAAAFALMLVVWHFPPTPRFVIPILPLMLAGFFTQAKDIVLSIRNAYRDRKQRVAALVFSAVLVVATAFAVWNNAVLAMEIAPVNAQGAASMMRDTLECADRIDRELPSDARILTDNDALVYLRTGRTSMRIFVPPKCWYTDNPDSMWKESARMPEVGTAHGMRYVLYHRDYLRNLSRESMDQFIAALETDPALRLLFRCGGAAVYEIR